MEPSGLPEDLNLPPEEAYEPPHGQGGQSAFDKLHLRETPPGNPELSSLIAASPNVDLIMRIPVTVKIVLGAATMPVGQLAKLGRGAVIPLDKRVGEPVDVVVNGQVVAHGEIVVVDDNGSRFGVSLTEVLARGPKGLS